MQPYFLKSGPGIFSATWVLKPGGAGAPVPIPLEWREATLIVSVRDEADGVAFFDQDDEPIALPPVSISGGYAFVFLPAGATAITPRAKKFVARGSTVQMTTAVSLVEVQVRPRDKDIEKFSPIAQAERIHA